MRTALSSRFARGFAFRAVVVFCAALCGCVSVPAPDPVPVSTPVPAPVPETPIAIETPLPAPEPARPASSGGLVEEIRGLVETGTPSSLAAALELIRSRDAGNTEFGRVMNGVIGSLFRTVYPAVKTQIPPQDLPQNHSYARILRDNEKGVYTSYPASRDFLEQVLPFLSLYPERTGENSRQAAEERLLSALPDLERGARQNPGSVLAPLFLGTVYERSRRVEDAFEQYSAAWALSPECYPAAIGLARVMALLGRDTEAAGLLSDLAIRFPDNLEVKRQLAIAYYRSADWSRAEPAIAEILQHSNRDNEFILMRAHVLVELGQFAQAQAPLDLYATVNSNNRLYLFLRARVQFEGYRNRDSAMNYLRSLLRNSGGVIDDEASVYAARLLMESARESDQTEGRSLLRQLLAGSNPSLTVFSLALEDAVRRSAWTDAAAYLVRLLAERRSNQDLLNAYTVEKGQGNNAAALSYARELYDRDRNFEDGNAAYITALIDTGRVDEALALLERRLQSVQGGVVKGRYYYLRSRTRQNEESAMNDLRSSLFEDPRNLDALIAMFEIYHRRRDERRAVYYLKQALALASDNPRLRRYETEYASLLGTL